MSTLNNSESKKNLKDHWNNVYTNNPKEKLSWFETDFSPMLNLLNQIKLDKKARIINIGAGNTTLIDELINLNYSNLIAVDISEIALNSLVLRVGKENIKTIVDDLTKSQLLKHIEPVDLWIDRAVLHFFTSPKEQENYFELLSNSIKSNGYVILAQFNTNSAKFCSGLPVFQYDQELLEKQLGSSFTLIDSFNYTYAMPSGDKREYIYTLFKKN
ncbi:MAG: methyltransferase domain-containing protein [Flavobacteriaceae bacterium]|jgi:cyclopropane fatty-acyl-phospholipid synthase-like methyltransferase|nr:methyltransferase domain-containing protein [Flavobacteriaceae bacterium]